MLPALGALATRAATAGLILDGSYKKRVSLLMLIFILAFAAAFDGLQFLLTFVPIPGIVIANMGIAAFGLFTLGAWFGILGVTFIDGKNALTKVALALGVSVGEIVPYIDALPLLVGGAVMTFLISRDEDRRAAEEAARKEHEAAAVIARVSEEAQLAA